MNENIEKLVEQKADEIIEHVDSVQIFVTFHSGGEGKTRSFEYGKGNFYARQGHVAEWLEIQRQFQKNYAIRKDNEDP